jgi:transposase
MGKPECPDCQALLQVVAQLQEVVVQLRERVRELEVRLNSNSSNSSTPPSANPLGALKPVVKKKSGRRAGGQPGHPPHLKQLLPAERVDATFEFVPKRCGKCQARLPEEAGPHDPAPTRHQVVELPPVIAHVTEYQGHYRICPSCAEVTHEPIPRELLTYSTGPRLTAALSYLSGCHGVSKRGVEEMADHLFAAPVSLGTVANLEQEMSAALEAPHQEAVTAVRAAEVKHADETSWKQRGKLCWLWTAATASVVAFVIHGKRSALGLTALLGREIYGIVCSDRWGVYGRVVAERRQLCWAHLKRDFKKILDRGGTCAYVGRRGLRLVKEVFAAWHAFREKQITRAQLQATIERLENRMQRLLMEGAILGDDKPVVAFCDNVLEVEPALWTFAHVEGVEPTNNFMERLLRRAVLWRRRSFGCWSPEGCRFVERILTVVQTRRLQGHNVLEYLHAALHAHRASQPCPNLLLPG